MADTKAAHQKNNKENAKVKSPDFSTYRAALSQPHPILQMQRVVGNRAVLDILQSGIKVGRKGDIFEKQAQKASDSISIPCASMDASDSHDPSGHIGKKSTNTPVLKNLPAKGSDNTRLPAAIRDALQSPGHPLDENTRSCFESNLGYDLGKVKIHTGSSALLSTRSINAKAYTIGNDVVFGQGQYNPGTVEGKKVIAHELAHVIQQSGMAEAYIQRLEANQPDPLESQAWEIENAELAIANNQAALINFKGNLIAVGPEELRKVDAEFRKTLSNSAKTLRMKISDGKDFHKDLKKTRDEFPVVSRVSAVFAWEFLPDMSIWDIADEHLNKAVDELKAGKFRAAVVKIKMAHDSYLEAYKEVKEYHEGAISGSDRAVTTLEWTRDISLITTGIIATVVTGGTAAGIVGGAMLGTGISATANIAQQATEQHLGLRKEIDWGGITFDAFIGLFTSFAGGAFGRSLLSKLLGSKGASTLLKKAVARFFEDVVSGKISSTMHIILRAIFDSLRGVGAVTPEQIGNQLWEDLTSPKSLIRDLLLGEYGRRLHTKASNYQSKKAAGSSTEAAHKNAEAALNIAKTKGQPAGKAASKETPDHAVSEERHDSGSKTAPKQPEKKGEIKDASDDMTKPAKKAAGSAPKTMKYSELIQLFVEKFKRPGLPEKDYIVYKTRAEYEKFYYSCPKVDPKSKPPDGFFDPNTATVHLPPDASTKVVLHESLHWVGHQSGISKKMGKFMNEAMADWLTTRVLGPRRVLYEYNKNVAFVKIMAKELGVATIENAFLHGNWDALDNALLGKLGSKGKVNEFYGLLRSVGPLGENGENLGRAMDMLFPKSVGKTAEVGKVAAKSSATEKIAKDILEELDEPGMYADAGKTPIKIDSSPDKSIPEAIQGGKNIRETTRGPKNTTEAIDEIEATATGRKTSEYKGKGYEAEAGTNIERPEVHAWRAKLGPKWRTFWRRNFPRWVNNIFHGNERPDMVAINEKEKVIIVGDVTSRPAATVPRPFATGEEMYHFEKTINYAKRVVNNLPEQYKDFKVYAQERYWELSGRTSKMVRVFPDITA